MELHSEQIRKLLEEREKNEKEIEQLERRNVRLKNREEYLTRKERSQRTHRLCTTGGIVESILPEVKHLTEAELYELMEQILHLPEAQQITRDILTEHERKAATAVGTVSSEH